MRELTRIVPSRICGRDDTIVGWVQNATWDILSADAITEQDSKNRGVFLSNIEDPEYTREWNTFFDDYVVYWEDFIEVCGEKIARNWNDSSLIGESDIDFSKLPDWRKILETMPWFGWRPSVWEQSMNELRDIYKISDDELYEMLSKWIKEKCDFFVKILWLWFYWCEPFWGFKVWWEQWFYWSSSLWSGGQNEFLHIHSEQGVELKKAHDNSKYSVRGKI